MRSFLMFTLVMGSMICFNTKIIMQNSVNRLFSMKITIILNNINLWADLFQN